MKSSWGKGVTNQSYKCFSQQKQSTFGFNSTLYYTCFTLGISAHWDETLLKVARIFSFGNVLTKLFLKHLFYQIENMYSDAAKSSHLVKK
jgi:hypothetical protein